jgi:TetR/AcrR family transcriptional repressor of lmrAB and yxaGH operons
VSAPLLSSCASSRSPSRRPGRRDRAAAPPPGVFGHERERLPRCRGAANGSLYHHFPGGKEELASAAIEAAAEQVEAALLSAFDATDDVVAAAQRSIDGMIAAFEADPRDGCPVAPTAIDAAGISEELRLAAAAAFARWSGVFERALHRTRDADTAAAQARVLLSAIEGALLLDRTSHGTAHLKALRDAVPILLAYVAPAVRELMG